MKTYSNVCFTNTRFSKSKYLIQQSQEKKDEWQERMMQVPGFIVLASEPHANTYRGIVEHSFSLGLSTDQTQFFWTSKKATSNFGGSFEIDGKRDAETEIYYWQKKLPDWKFEIFDARDDEKLPVYLHWDLWLNGNLPADTLSAVNDKYAARNLTFMQK